MKYGILGVSVLAIAILLYHIKPDYFAKSLNTIIEDPLVGLQFSLQIFLTCLDKYTLPDIDQATELQITNRLISDVDVLRYFDIEIVNNRVVDFESNESRGDHGFEYGEQIDTLHEYELRYTLSDDEGVYIDKFEKFGLFYFTNKFINNNDLPYFLTQTIVDNMFKDEISFTKLVTSDVYSEENLLLDSGENAYNSQKSLSELFNVDALQASQDPHKLRFVLRFFSTENTMFEESLNEMINSYFAQLNTVLSGIVEIEFEFERSKVQNEKIHKIRDIIDANDDYGEYIRVNESNYFMLSPIDLTSTPELRFSVYSPERGSEQSIEKTQILHNQKEGTFEVLYYAGRLHKPEYPDIKEFVFKNDFKNVFEVILRQFFIILHIPTLNSLDEQIPLKLDSMVRVSIIKNLIKFSKYMKLVHMSYKDLSKHDKKQVQNLTLRGLETRNEILQIISEKAHGEQKVMNEARALNLLIKLNYEFSKSNII